MYTANTMASAIEALGMSMPYSSSIPASTARAGCIRRRRTRSGDGHAVDALKFCIEANLMPRDIMTAKALENSVRLVMVTGGSTNATIHLIAMARSCGVNLSLEDFRRISHWSKHRAGPRKMVPSLPVIFPTANPGGARLPLSDVARWLDGLLEGPDDRLAFDEAVARPPRELRQVGEVLGHCLARDRHAVAVERFPCSNMYLRTPGVPPTWCKSSKTFRSA